MRFYISATGIKRLAVSGAAARNDGIGGVWRGMKWKSSAAAVGSRRSHQKFRLLFGLLLPFFFVRTEIMAVTRLGRVDSVAQILDPCN
ncbi:hypothetical protein ACS0TY_016219 [Phlomoides rotata]